MTTETKTRRAKAKPAAKAKADTSGAAPPKAKVAKAAAPVAAPAANGAYKVPKPGTKLAALCAMLQTPDGATAEELMEALGWQKNTVLAYISYDVKRAGFKASWTTIEGRGRVWTAKPITA